MASILDALRLIKVILYLTLIDAHCVIVFNLYFTEKKTEIR